MRKVQKGTHKSVNIANGLDVEGEIKKDSKMSPKFFTPTTDWWRFMETRGEIG